MTSTKATVTPCVSNTRLPETCPNVLPPKNDCFNGHFNDADIRDHTPIAPPLCSAVPPEYRGGSRFSNFSSGTSDHLNSVIAQLSELLKKLLEYIRPFFSSREQTGAANPLGFNHSEGHPSANRDSHRDNGNGHGGRTRDAGQSPTHRSVGSGESNAHTGNSGGIVADVPQHGGKAAWGSSQDTANVSRQTGTASDMAGATPLNLSSFTKRAGRNDGPFQTDFLPRNVQMNNGSATINLAGPHGGEIRNDAPPGATKYGSYYYTSKKTITGDGQNLSGFMYGNNRKLEIDLDEGGWHGNKDIQEAGIWWNDKKIAIKKFTAEEYGFKNFSDQPMTYKTDIAEGRIAISIKDASGKFQQLTEFKNPAINEKLLRDIDFKQFANAWGVSGRYNDKGAPAKLEVLDWSYKPF